MNTLRDLMPDLHDVAAIDRLEVIRSSVADAITLMEDCGRDKLDFSNEGDAIYGDIGWSIIAALAAGHKVTIGGIEV